MTWSDFYLACFLVGFSLSVVALLFEHFHLHFHLPHGAHGLHGPSGGGQGAASLHGGHHAGEGLSPFNFATFTAFLAWFGGSGYILTRYATVWHLIALGLAFLFGLTGAAAVFWVMSKLIAKDENLDPADYEMAGVLGRVVSGIREGGTGEIVYVQGGTRHSASARSENGTAIPREIEVVVTRYEKGIAYVRRWDELAAEEEPGGGPGERT